MLGFFSRISYF